MIILSLSLPFIVFIFIQHGTTHIHKQCMIALLRFANGQKQEEEKNVAD